MVAPRLPALLLQSIVPNEQEDQGDGGVALVLFRYALAQALQSLLLVDQAGDGNLSLVLGRVTVLVGVATMRGRQGENDVPQGFVIWD